MADSALVYGIFAIQYQACFHPSLSKLSTLHDRLTRNVAVVVNVWLNSRFVTTQKRFAMNKGAEQSRNVRAKKSADDDVSGGKVTAAAAVDWERERGRPGRGRPQMITSPR